MTLRLRFAFALICLLLLLPAPAFGSKNNRVDIGEYDGRNITAIEIVFEGSPADAGAQADFLAMLKVAPNTEYSAVRVRDSLEALFRSNRIASARVEITPVSANAIKVRFVIQRQIVVADIRLDLSAVTGAPISTDELRGRLNLVRGGARLSRQSVQRNVDEIQSYLRDRGYYNASIETSQLLDSSGYRATVNYHINLGEPSRMAAFDVAIKNFDPAPVRPSLALQPGVPFTRQALSEDLEKIRQAMITKGYLAPLLDEPRVERDAEKNQMTVTLSGSIGPKVNVKVDNYKISAKAARDLFPITRVGNIDTSAIVEGGRRLRNKLQEEGYFFAEVTPVCSVTPALPGVDNGTRDTCDNLAPDALDGHEVNVTYQAELGRRLKLSEIRITGTNKISYEDVAADLKTQKANSLGFIPFLGYGRGYTSVALLEQDRRIIQNRMRDFGFRHSQVSVSPSVLLNGEDLIITFNVNEGPLTRVAAVEVRGNKIYSDERLRKEIKTIVGGPLYRSLIRVDLDDLRNLYARAGYYDAEIGPSIVELPKKGADEQVRLVYNVRAEGTKTFINLIIVNGVSGDVNTQRKKREAIVRTTLLAPGDLLRADHLNEAERALYATDAYAEVNIHPEPAGETPAGFAKRDVIIDVEEKKPRVMDYGGGYSTDFGPLGLFEISNVNLFNNLKQGAMRLRFSARQQAVRFEYIDPHFKEYGNRQFAPLTLSATYLRDTTVTRFFRSTIDRGTFGIVQRVDANGNPIDEFGIPTGEPTINRFTLGADTQRLLDPKTHTIVFVHYAYDDVRLYNLESLVIKDILLPDRSVRLSRFGVSLVRDTREKCEPGVPGNVTETSSRFGEVCRFNQLDPTRGSFLDVGYSVALRQLGGNVSFNKLQGSYRRYYKLNALHGTTLAGNFTLGLANIFNPRDRDGNDRIDETDLTLPISERFFSGGSTSLRGFNFEEAGPRQSVIPVGTFLDKDKKPIFLSPFTVPLGGNALAILNLEARVPLTRNVFVVPFYDGGNVFRRVGDLFGKHAKIDTTNLVTAINSVNLRSHWTNTVGLGFRIQTPLGGALAVDYGFLLKAPEFLVPQRGPTGRADDYNGVPAIYRLNRGQIQIRFTQAF